MHAYLNEQTNMVEIYHGEPDEIVAVEEFEARQHAEERQAKINELLAQLKELGLTVNVAGPLAVTVIQNDTVNVQSVSTDTLDTAAPEQTIAAADIPAAEIPDTTEPLKLKKRW